MLASDDGEQFKAKLRYSVVFFATGAVQRQLFGQDLPCGDIATYGVLNIPQSTCAVAIIFCVHRSLLCTWYSVYGNLSVGEHAR